MLYVITKSNWGGAQRYVYDIATNLPPEYEPVVAAGMHGLMMTKLKKKSIRTISIPVLGRDITLVNDILAFFALYRLFREEKPHVVHLNSSKAGVLGSIAGRLAGVRHIVFTVHGWPYSEPVSKLHKLVRWLPMLLTMLCVHRTITVSHFAMHHAPLGFRTQTIHNGIGEQEFLDRETARAEICKMAGIATDTFMFGSIAELHVNKGIDILIEATYLVDDVQVVVIGEGEERPVLEGLIRDLDLENRVHLLGFVDNAARYLKAFDAFVLPSRTEVLGYVLLEAGMAGVPVIASAVGGIPEVVHDQITGDLYHAFNDLALAESMEDFKRSPNTIRRYSEALKERVARHFNLEDMVRKTLAVYER